MNIHHHDCILSQPTFLLNYFIPLCTLMVEIIGSTVVKAKMLRKSILVLIEEYLFTFLFFIKQPIYWSVSYLIIHDSFMREENYYRETILLQECHYWIKVRPSYHWFRSSNKEKGRYFSCIQMHGGKKTFCCIRPNTQQLIFFDSNYIFIS